VTHLIRKWQTLPAGERWLVLEALALLFWARIAFAFLPLPIALRAMGQTPAGTTQRAGRGNAEAVGLAVSRAARYAPIKAACLQRAFAAFLMLRRRGLPATVHFGVRHDKGTSLAAHAWSMSANIPVTGIASMEEFIPIAIFRA
jgi:hypothetical protein